ncbi:MAG: hypothetical protein WC966_06565 [Bradymonadales bacterium]|jgi:hypothetical protein
MRKSFLLLICVVWCGWIVFSCDDGKSKTTPADDILGVCATQGEEICDTGYTYICVGYKDEGLKWQKSLICHNNASCASRDECGECANGTVVCERGAVRKCIEGEYKVQMRCDGECKPDKAECERVCSDGQLKCIDGASGGELNECRDGEWKFKSNCSEGVSCVADGSDGGICKNNNDFCTDAKIYACADGVASGAPIEVCKGVCNSDKKTCGECIDGQSYCSNNNSGIGEISTCHSGTLSPLVACAQAVSCNAGGKGCGECKDGSVRCKDSKTTQCLSGAWAAEQPCADGQACKTASECNTLSADSPKIQSLTAELNSSVVHITALVTDPNDDVSVVRALGPTGSTTIYCNMRRAQGIQYECNVEVSNLVDAQNVKLSYESSFEATIVVEAMDRAGNKASAEVKLTLTAREGYRVCGGEETVHGDRENCGGCGISCPEESVNKMVTQACVIENGKDRCGKFVVWCSSNSSVKTCKQICASSSQNLVCASVPRAVFVAGYSSYDACRRHDAPGAISGIQGCNVEVSYSVIGCSRLRR